MKHPHRFAVATGSILLALTFRASAALTFSINDGVGAPDAITIDSGSTFSFTLSLGSTAEQTIGLGYSFEVLGAGSGFFDVIGRNLTGTVYPDVTTNDATLFIAANAVLDPTPGSPAGNTLDLGGLIADGASPTGTGTLDVADFSFITRPGITPGTYTIQTIINEATDQDFGTVAVASASYQVTVLPSAAVPEVGSSAVFLCLALLGMEGFRRKFRERVRVA